MITNYKQLPVLKRAQRFSELNGPAALSVPQDSYMPRMGHVFVERSQIFLNQRPPQHQYTQHTHPLVEKQWAG